MNYCSITCPDINNGIGCRVTLWVSGCPHHCQGCHNPSTWSASSGKEYDIQTFVELQNYLDLEYISGLTISGGEPLDITDTNKLGVILDLCRRFRDRYGNSKDLWVYTGYKLEELKKHKYTRDILEFVDVLVDGPYIESLRNISLPFRGSLNQNIYKKVNNKFKIYEIE